MKMKAFQIRIKLTAKNIKPYFIKGIVLAESAKLAENKIILETKSQIISPDLISPNIEIVESKRLRTDFLMQA